MTQAIIIPVMGDDLDESNKTFAVDLSDPINATLADKRGIGTITDDDTAALSIDDVARVEGDSGTTSMYFDVRLSASSVETITVDYATSDSAALAGSDYVAVRGTLTFPSGEMTRVITVTVLGDTVLEVDETFFVNLSDVINGTIADRQGRGTIMDDDGTRIYLPLVLQSS